jgi:Predicted enzyme of the cupin superfamily
MITATPFLAAAADAKLEDWGPLEEATGEPMHTLGTTLWSGRRRPGGRRLGVHARALPVEPGAERVRDILSGRMTVTPDGGEPAEIGPGDTAVFPRAGPGPGRSTRRSGSSTSCSDREPG